jgi:hypothetical protein
MPHEQARIICILLEANLSRNHFYFYVSVSRTSTKTLESAFEEPIFMWRGPGLPMGGVTIVILSREVYPGRKHSCNCPA